MVEKPSFARLVVEIVVLLRSTVMRPPIESQAVRAYGETRGTRGSAF